MIPPEGLRLEGVSTQPILTEGEGWGGEISPNPLKNAQILGTGKNWEGCKIPMKTSKFPSLAPKN